jgi:hypothetical protein
MQTTFFFGVVNPNDGEPLDGIMLDCRTSVITMIGTFVWRNAENTLGDCNTLAISTIWKRPGNQWDVMVPITSMHDIVGTIKAQTIRGNRLIGVTIGKWWYGGNMLAMTVEGPRVYDEHCDHELPPTHRILGHKRLRSTATAADHLLVYFGSTTAAHDCQHA